MIRIGFYVNLKKIEKMKLNEFFETLKRDGRLKLIMIDSSFPLEVQGPFHLILHKVTSELLEAKQSERSRNFIEDLKLYLKKHTEVIVVDPIESQLRTLDRTVILTLLKRVEIDLPKEFRVENARWLLYERQEEVYDTSEISFPVVCKAVVAGGVSKAHKMGIAFCERHLHFFEPPFIAQEYLNHNATIFKAFAIGDTVQVVKRESLPNFFSNDHEVIFFDSQTTLPHLNQENQSATPTMTMEIPPMEMFVSLSRAISKHFDLTLFGFDVITCIEKSTHAVIDINYFPGFIGVTNFENLLVDTLWKKINAVSN